MPHALRIALVIGIALLASRADAQPVYDDAPTPERLREEAYQDSLRANWDAESRLAASFQVLTVLRQGGGFLYDVEDGSEDVIRLWTGSPIVVRTPGIGRTMVVVDPAGTLQGTRDQNAFTIPPDRSLGLINIRGPVYGSTPWLVTHHAVRVLVCTEDGPGTQCRTWTEASPRSGGPGLTLTVVELPEGGGVYAPSPYGGTGGGSSGGSGTTRPQDDGSSNQ